MPHALKAPGNPEVLVGTIAAMRLLSGERAPASALERQLLARLRALRLDPDVARRIVATFDARPAADRQLLGRFADRSHALDDIAQGTHPDVVVRDHRRDASSGGTTSSASTASRTTAASGTVGPLDETRTIDGTLPGIRYTVRYLGLWCQEETSGPGSDEIYVITSGLAINAGVNAGIGALSHPMNTAESHYSDVDSGERRLGPVAVVYTGSPDTLSLAVTVMEHDYGDPNHYRDEIQTFVDGAIALASFLYKPAAVLAYFKENIVDAINWILGTGDDVIASAVVTWERDALEALAIQTPGEYQGTRQQVLPTIGPAVNVPTGLFAHFVTHHDGDGAKYVVGFDIERDPLRPPPIIL